MNPEKQRIAIAEACGWRRRASTNKDFEFVWMHKDEGYCYALPDYLSDLNAMREAVECHRQKNQFFCVEYARHLAQAAMPGSNESSFFFGSLHLHLMIHATASERAEALLRTLNKWEES